MLGQRRIAMARRRQSSALFPLTAQMIVMFLLWAVFRVPVSPAQGKTGVSSLNEEGEESGEEILAREQFFYTRRAGGPGKVLPEDAFARAVEEKRLLEQALRNSNTPLPPG